MRSVLFTAFVAFGLAACGDDDGEAAADAAPGDDGGSADGGSEDATNVTPIDFGSLALDEWTWLDVPGMVCGNGSATGIAINPTQRSNKLMLLFQGGGACWEAANCYGIVVPVTASHLDGYTATTFNNMRPQIDNIWALQRDEPTSLFTDATWVFVPYCTGDLHAGTRENVYEALGQQRTMHHKGAMNVDAMLGRIDDYAFSEIFAIGISAGGFGVQLNWDRITAAFPAVTTHAFADGAQMVPIESARWGTMNNVWAPRYPSGCTDCMTRFDNTATYWRTAHPAMGGRYALTNSLQDGTLALFFGYNAADMKAASLIIGNAMTGENASLMVDDNSHTMLATPNKMTSTGTSVRTFIEAWARDGAEFVTVGP
jgi:hypothetical protein